MEIESIYPDEKTRRLCEAGLARIRRLMRSCIYDAALIGRELETIKSALGHGRWYAWLATNLHWSPEQARKYRLLARAVFGNPECGLEPQPQILEWFTSVEAAIEYAQLSPDVQREVVARRAFTPSALAATVWDYTMRAHLADTRLDYDRRMGDVLHAIEQALSEDNAELAQAAQALYDEYREQFALLADLAPSELDDEVGVQEVREQRIVKTMRVELVEGCGQYWVCEMVDGQWVPVVQVRSYLRTPSGTILAVFPRVSGDPVEAAMGFAVEDAATRRARMYG